MHAIEKAKLNPDDSDLYQLSRAMRRQIPNFGIDTGSTNHLSIALDPDLESYVAGTPVRVLVANSNTGATDINVSGLGARAIKRPNGSDLQSGDLVAGMIASLIDTGTNYQLGTAVNIGGGAGTTNVFNVNIPYTADIGGTNALVGMYTPAITSINEGQFIAIKVGHTNTGPVTMQVNALTAIPLYRNDGQPLQSGDLLVNETILLENHSTYYQMMMMVPSQIGARSDFPVYPEILTNNGVSVLSTTVGSISIVDQPQTWLWRGLSKFSTALFTTPQRTFTTIANKIYHLRWDAPGTGRAANSTLYPAGLYYLADLADHAYNPLSKADRDQTFDSSYDSMLMASIYTNASNVLTVLPLINKDRWHTNVKRLGAQMLGDHNAVGRDIWWVYLSRAPKCSLEWINEQIFGQVWTCEFEIGQISEDNGANNRYYVRVEGFASINVTQSIDPSPGNVNDANEFPAYSLNIDMW